MRRDTCRARVAGRADREPCGVEEKFGSLVAAALGIRRLGAQQVQTRALQFIERPEFGRVHECARNLKRAGLQAQLGGGEGSVRPPGGVARQRDGALEERGRSGEPATGLGPVSEALELGGNFGSSGPAAAAARCHARRSGSAC